jgi:hypothetical protein
MSVPNVADLRRKVGEAAEPLDHPTKTGYHNVEQNIRLANKPHKYGKVVYFDGGAVGIKNGGKFLVARGDDHDESLWALAQHLGFVDYGPEATVDEVTADEFKTLQTAKVTSKQ